MRSRAIDFYVICVCLAALGSLTFLDWASLFALDIPALSGFTALLVLGLISEGLSLSYTVGKSAGNHSVSWIPALACVLLFGPTATVVFLASSNAIGEFLIRQKPPLRATFNVAQYIISSTLAGMAFVAFGGEALATVRGSAVGGDFLPQFGPFIVFGIVLYSLNHILVTLAIAISQGLPFREVWGALVGSSGTNIIYDLLVSPIAIVAAFLYFELGITGLVLLLLPLFFIRESYLKNLQWQEANRDLLKVLVKAIETRDPYTSGHSLRVSGLARRLAVELGLASKKVDAVETAALLHDIGKIEAVFSDILRKPGSLTQEERSIIESHVTKGEELLKSLSSFGADVIGAVRHHHERIDGNGYPDGLVAEEIPVSARIIKVCDAVDAMLSDRPYRSALDVSDVRVQLRINSKLQFDPRVVTVLLEGGILEDFAHELQRGVVEPSASVASPVEMMVRVTAG